MSVSSSLHLVFRAVVAAWRAPVIPDPASLLAEFKGAGLKSFQLLLAVEGSQQSSFYLVPFMYFSKRHLYFLLCP